MIELADVNAYIRENHIYVPTSGEGIVKKILTAEEELEQLVGLRSVKRMIKKIKPSLVDWSFSIPFIEPSK